MRWVQIALLATVLSLGAGGCLFVSDGHYRGSSQHHRVSKGHQRRAACRPSHYWDGQRCRHKGKGRGARKHDY